MHREKAALRRPKAALVEAFFGDFPYRTSFAEMRPPVRRAFGKVIKVVGPLDGKGFWIQAQRALLDKAGRLSGPSDRLGVRGVCYITLPFEEVVVKVIRADGEPVFDDGVGAEFERKARLFRGCDDPERLGQKPSGYNKLGAVERIGHSSVGRAPHCGPPGLMIWCAGDNGRCPDRHVSFTGNAI